MEIELGNGSVMIGGFEREGRCGKKFAKRQYSQRFCSSGCRNGYHNDRMRELIELGKAARGVKEESLNG